MERINQAIERIGINFRMFVILGLMISEIMVFLC